MILDGREAIKEFWNFNAMVQNSVMRVGSDTFGDPIFQKGLQN